MSFALAVHGLVRRIPRGQVATYGQIATCLGRPRAARAVGWAMTQCPAALPWHRVVNARGGISLRSNVNGMLTQRLLLEQEGVRVRHGRVSLRRYQWRRRVRALSDRTPARAAWRCAPVLRPGPRRVRSGRGDRRIRR